MYFPFEWNAFGDCKPTHIENAVFMFPLWIKTKVAFQTLKIIRKLKCNKLFLKYLLDIISNCNICSKIVCIWNYNISCQIIDSLQYNPFSYYIAHIYCHLKTRCYVIDFYYSLISVLFLLFCYYFFVFFLVSSAS